MLVYCKALIRLPVWPLGLCLLGVAVALCSGPAAAESTSPAAPNSSTTGASPPSNTAAASTPSAASTGTKSDALTSASSAAALAPPTAAAGPVLAAVRTALADKSLLGKHNHADDIAALVDDYGARSEPLWTKDGAYTDRAKAIIAELGKAADWGLEPSDFAITGFAGNAGPDAQGAAEAQLAMAALKYARFARGGRLDPVALSNILDMKPPVEDPKVVLAELARALAPDAYLRELNPKHAGFETLRQALLKARGPRPEGEKIDPALLVRLPFGTALKPGTKDDQISQLRQRLKMPAGTLNDERLYDDALATAVRGIQTANGIKSNGILNNRTREVLNKEGQPGSTEPQQTIDRLTANMERWRWLPVDLGPFYVMNNIPEFQSEIWKGAELKLRQKMIVGQPSWPTPVLTAAMEFVIFHPSWGVPPGIMMKELQPRLRTASGDFFAQIFGGGSGGAQVLQDYKLTATLNGKAVDPNSVDWSTADISKFGFSQPPGTTNPLGLVKFRFPNSHNVYMHDTPQRDLFGQTFRALSHGCMRVAEPRQTAEVILGEDQGWSADKVGELWRSGGSVTLNRKIPVYLVYFTARVANDGRLVTFGDIYGHDGRVIAALRGHALRYVAPQAVDPSEAVADQPARDRRSPKRG